MDFNSKLHQKVSYWGTSQELRKGARIFAVVRDDYPGFYSMGPDENVIIHRVSKFGEVLYNVEPEIKERFRVKKSELKLEGDLST